MLPGACRLQWIKKHKQNGKKIINQKWTVHTYSYYKNVITQSFKYQTIQNAAVMSSCAASNYAFFQCTHNRAWAETEIQTWAEHYTGEQL